MRHFWFSIRHYITQNPIKSGVVFVVIVVYYFSLPNTLFKSTYSTVIESKEGRLLGAKIAQDMQWRFPENDTVPDKFKQCIVVYEDAHFYKHWGFNPVSMYHAFLQNKRSGKITRGGSTITQQVIRMHRNNKSRTYAEKIIEIVLATRLEFRYSKEKILSLYAAHAPFGGNTVGLEAAAWRIFGVQSTELSWAESATLAVLPNAPGLITVNKNRKILLKKRNFLLKKLLNNNIIDYTTYELALLEPLPEKTFNLPRIAPHLLSKVSETAEGKRIATTLNFKLQERLNRLVSQHYETLKQNHVYNIAVLVVDVKTRDIMAYIGNAPTDLQHQKDVDIVDKPRSTGSILKPFLFTSMLNDGNLLPDMLLKDIPTAFGGFRPENFNLEYRGAVPAGKALARSLNIPAVNMLYTYGVDKFYNDLNKIKLRTINKGANHYGLSLILGGAESTLWDLTRAYTSMASVLNHYDETQGKYYQNEFVDLKFDKRQNVDFGFKGNESFIWDAGSIYTTFNTLMTANRPEADENWEFFSGTRRIAWKTGTSYGFRDAWSIGVTPEYVVGVWIGNADGEGRPSLTGLNVAAPLLFEVYDQLPATNWFKTPYDEMIQERICEKSGHIASEFCEKTDSLWVPKRVKKTLPCPYHQLVHLDISGVHRVNLNCESPENMTHKSWFVLPPVQAHYYQSFNPFYKPVPPFREDCADTETYTLDFISPTIDDQIFLPKDFDEHTSRLIVRAKHAHPNQIVYWYLNERYIGSTNHLHEMAILPPKGVNLLTIVDDKGNERTRKFKIL